VAHDLSILPTDLPVPRDDGAADHLPGTAVPPPELPATTGGTFRVDRPPAGASRLVRYASASRLLQLDECPLNQLSDCFPIYRRLLEQGKCLDAYGDLSWLGDV
jgi:hypothetical protein